MQRILAVLALVFVACSPSLGPDVLTHDDFPDPDPWASPEVTPAPWAPPEPPSNDVEATHWSDCRWACYHKGHAQAERCYPMKPAPRLACLHVKDEWVDHCFKGCDEAFPGGMPDR